MLDPKLSPSHRSISATADRPRARARLRVWLCTLAGLLGTALLAQVAAADELEPFQASYVWLWHGAPVALSNMNLQHRDGDIWVYSSSTKPRGLGHLYPMRPNLQSIMRITAEGVQPLSFMASGSGRSHDADVKFDWNAGRATGNYEDATVDLPITPGVQDDLSVQVALLVQLLQGKTPDRAMEIDKHAVREYDYVRAGDETLDTAVGSVATTIYVIQHPGSPRFTRFWCAPSKGYIPMQVQQKRLDHVEWTMIIRSLKRP